MHILICCRQISKTGPNNIAHLHILIVYKHLHIKDHCWNTTCLHVSNEYLREAGKLRVLQRLDEEVLSQRVLVDPFQTFLFCTKWTKFTSQFNLTHFSYLLPSISYQIYINKKGLKKKKKKILFLVEWSECLALKEEDLCSSAIFQPFFGFLINSVSDQQNLYSRSCLVESDDDDSNLSDKIWHGTWNIWASYWKKFEI